MKSPSLTVAGSLGLLGITCAICLTPVTAQTIDDEKATDGSERRDERVKARAEAQAQLLGSLDLGDQQRAQVEALLARRQQQRQDLFEQARSGERSRQQMQATRDEMRALNEKTDEDLKEVMGDEQFARYQEGRQKQQEMRRGEGRRGERGARAGRRGGGGGRRGGGRRGG